MTPRSAGAALPRDGQMRSVQVLRAVAALAVVAFHATILWRDRFDAAVPPWQNGNAGVDLFFVISGFIMVWSSGKLAAAAQGWRRFLVLRLVRIVPLYWLVTACKLAILAAAPGAAQHTHPTAWNSVASFLFLPSRDATGTIRPVLDVGWTLSFEMLFYLVFAAALALHKPAWRIVTPGMAALALLCLVLPPHAPAIASLANPIVLEFVMGVGAAGLLRARAAPPLPFCLALGAAGLAVLALAPAGAPWPRALVWGPAATATLIAGVWAEPRIGRLLPAFAVSIGEASYSLYLTHGFVLPAVGMAAARAGLHGRVLGAALLAASLVLSTALALAVYRWVELPVTIRLRHLTRGRDRPALAASPL